MASLWRGHNASIVYRSTGKRYVRINSTPTTFPLLTSLRRSSSDHSIDAGRCSALPLRRHISIDTAPAPELQQTSCTSLLLSIGGTVGQTDSILHMHMHVVTYCMHVKLGYTVIQCWVQKRQSVKTCSA